MAPIMYTQANDPRENRAVLREHACANCKQTWPPRATLKSRVSYLFSMKFWFIEVKMDNLHLRNSQRRAQVAQSWPKGGEKRYFKSESRQPSITKKREDCD